MKHPKTGDWESIQLGGGIANVPYSFKDSYRVNPLTPHTPPGVYFSGASHITPPEPWV